MPDNVVEALIVQNRERAYLKAVVDSGAMSEDPLVANSCRWLIDRKVRLYALSRVGKDYEGPQNSGEGARVVVMPNYSVDGSGTVYGDPPVGYAVTSQEEREEALFSGAELPPPVRDPNVAEWIGDFDGNPAVCLPGLIAFNRPSRRTSAEILKTIKHEVQHSADKHATNALGMYKTEYRAYTYQEAPGIRSKALEPQTRRTFEGYDMVLNDHQFNILQSLYRDSASYPYVRENWQEAAFRSAIEAYMDPDTEGFNRFNSVRVDNLYLALEAGAAATEVVTPAVNSAIDALQPAEKKYVASESRMWKEKLDFHLVGPARKQVHLRLMSPVGRAPARPVTPTAA